MSTPVSIDSRFVAQHEDFLRRLARGLVGQDPAAVDDAVQDVWARVLVAPPRESPRAYLAATLRIWRDAERKLKPRADHTELYHYLRRLPRPLRPPSRAAASRPSRSRPRPRRST